MLTCSRRSSISLSALGVLALLASACQKVPLLAPSGSTITLTASTTALSANGTTTIIAQVLEAAGTPPHSGTHVTFATTLGRIEPAETNTDINGRVVVTFVAGGANGTATITALSGGATTGANGAIKIAVGTAAVGRVTVNANPAAVPAIGGSTTVTAFVLDVNGNPLVATPVAFTTTAGTLSSGVVLTDANGSASSVLTTSAQATVTASVGAQVTTTTGSGTGATTSSSGQASGTVTVNVSSAPTITITPPTTVQRGLPATFTVTVTAATANGSAVKEVSVNWGDGQSESLGAFVGAQTISHRFDNDGTFSVSATVTDVNNGSNRVSTSVVVIPLARPSVVVNPTPTTQTVGGSVTFAITVTPPTGVGIVSSSIDYGDGSSDELGGATSASKTHSYAAAGTKTVVVSVLDTASRTSTGSTSVVITP